MDYRMKEQITAFQSRTRRKRVWYKIISVLACIVIFCTTYVLILPAITMSSKALHCTYAESVHTHTADCTDETGKLICGKSDLVLHTHTADCYDEEGSFVCPLGQWQAHAHTEDCYSADGDIICDLPELEAHAHSADCYDENGALVCQKLELLEHIHDESCFISKSEAAEIAAQDETGEPPVQPALTDLNGQNLAIVTTVGGEHYALTANLASNVNGVSGLDSQKVILNSEGKIIGEAPLWTFTKQDDGTYYISPVGAETDTQYLYLRKIPYENNESNPQGSLTLESDPQKITIEQLTNGSYMLVSGSSAVNLNQSDNSHHFWCFKSSEQPESSQFQFLQAGGTADPAPVLDGQTFALVVYCDNQADTKGFELQYIAMLNEIKGDGLKPSLIPTDKVTASDSNIKITATEEEVSQLKVWACEKNGETDTYYLKTTVDGVKYIQINNNSVVLTNEISSATAFTAIADAKGRYRLDSSGGKCLNLYAGDPNQVFAAWNIPDETVSDTDNVYFYLVTDFEQEAPFTKPPVITDTITPNGTVINLFDYWRVSEDEAQNSDENGNQGINAGHLLQFRETGGKGINEWTGSAAVRQGIVAPQLDTNGFPVLAGAGGESLAYLFDPAYTGNETLYRNAYRKVGGLLQLDEQGYYSYDSTNNYAYFNENKAENPNLQFTLYDGPAVRHHKEAHKDIIGMFFPFDDYPNNGPDHLANSSDLNHYFGMTLTSRFVHRYGGYTRADRETATTFEFSGDDDVWIFIDNKLVADLGGIHDEASVIIDFTKGEIKISKVYSEGAEGNAQTDVVTKFADIFTGPEDGLVDNIINGVTYKTFKDNTYHTLKFFYLERGGYASNMKLKYNLSSFPASKIVKEDQYGNPIPGATFQVTTHCNESYEETKDSDKTSHSFTTDENGEILFADGDGMPLTLKEIKDKYGEYFKLTETVIPPGYRTIDRDVKLHVTDQTILCGNGEWSGIWSNATLRVSSPNEVPIIKSTEPDGNVKIEGVDLTSPTSGTMFAVILRYIGDPIPEGLSDAEVEQLLKDSDNWEPVTGNSRDGYYTVTAETNPILAAIHTVQTCTYHDHTFSLAPSGAMEFEMDDLPGDLSTYYRMLGEGEKWKTQYTIAYYYTEGYSPETGFDYATKENTKRVYATLLDQDWINDANILVGEENGGTGDTGNTSSGEKFLHSFGATIYIPNLINRLAVQKKDEEGTGVDGATFAFYKVEQEEKTDTNPNPPVYYLADDGITQILLKKPDENGTGGTAQLKGDNTRGTYTVNQEKGTPAFGTITVTINGNVYTISPQKNGDNVNLVSTTRSPAAEQGEASGQDSDITHVTEYTQVSEPGTAVFTRVLPGYYYIREIKAPKGYKINRNEVMLYVSSRAVYANAGDEDDGITVGRGPGYLSANMHYKAFQRGIDNTLSWIYTNLKVSPRDLSNNFHDITETNYGTKWGYATSQYFNWSEDASEGLVTKPEDAFALALRFNPDKSNNQILNYEKLNAETVGESYPFKQEIYNAAKEKTPGKFPADSLTRRRIFTNVGWSYLEIYQFYEYGNKAADFIPAGTANSHSKYDDWRVEPTKVTGDNRLDLAHLFSRSIYIQVTDERVTGELHISKTEENPVKETNDDPTGTGTDAKEFQFTVELFRREEKDGTYTEEPLEGSYDYTIWEKTAGNTEYTPTTKTGKIQSGGKIHLRHNQKAVITGLPMTAYYRITEEGAQKYITSAVRDKGKVSPVPHPEAFTSGEMTFGNIVTGKLYWRTYNNGEDFYNITTVDFTNLYHNDLTIAKEVAGLGAPLAGAKFQLKKTADGTTSYYTGVDQDGKAQWSTDLSDAATLTSEIKTVDGVARAVVFAGRLDDGTYSLEETEAPDGYYKLSSALTFTIKQGVFETLSPAGTIGEIKNPKLLTVFNSGGQELPLTGGSGALPYTIGGALLLAGSLLYGCLYWRKRKRRQR